MPSRYRLASTFVVRMAGVPIDLLEQLGSPRTLAATRALIVAEDALDERARVLQSALDRTPDLSAAAKAALRCAIRRARVKPAGLDRWADAIAAHNRAADECERRRAALETIAAEEEQATEQLVWRSAAEHLPGFGIFSSALLRFPFDRPPTRRYVRTALLYLQRLCAKNDTVSAYGPTAWGRVDAQARGFTVTAQPGIARRDVFYERWAVEQVAEAIGRDPVARLELAPRLHPFFTVEAEGVRSAETAALLPLDAPALGALALVDGERPAHRFSEEQQRELARLAEVGVVIWRAEPLPMATHGLEVLAADVAGWRDGPARARWSAILAELLAEQARFATGRLEERRRATTAAASGLAKLGASPPKSAGHLYSAYNPIGENCERAADVVLGGDLVEQLTVDAAPWYDFWRDAHAMVARRATVPLRALLDRAGGRLALPAFLARCREAGIELTTNGVQRLAAGAFEELQAAVRETWSGGADAHRRTLGEPELALLRRRFPVEPVDEFAWPSVDVQIAASSTEAVARGDYEVVVSELHPASATAINVMSWGCPDQAAHQAALASVTARAPTPYFGQRGPSLTAHTALRLFEWLPGQATFVAPQRRDRSWPWVPPTQVDVHGAPDGDVRLCGPDGRDLGSFTHSWMSAYAMHPFKFAWAPHTPRLYSGRVVVQRETWVVRASDLPDGGSLAGRVDRLRADKGWPRYVFIAPGARALSSAGVGGISKDVKPVFVDLESVFGIETLDRWLRKFADVECTEMLPEPSQIPWREADGRFSFELRMLVEPG